MVWHITCRFYNSSKRDMSRIIGCIVEDSFIYNKSLFQKFRSPKDKVFYLQTCYYVKEIKENTFLKYKQLLHL